MALISLAVDYRFRRRSGGWQKAQALCAVQSRSDALVQAELRQRQAHVLVLALLSSRLSANRRTKCVDACPVE